MRIADDERAALALKEKQSRDARGYSHTRRWRSLGAFVVWAALQWKPHQLELIPEAPAPFERKRRGKKEKAKKKHARRRAKVVPKRRRRGTTKGRGRKGGKK